MSCLYSVIFSSLIQQRLLGEHHRGVRRLSPPRRTSQRHGRMFKLFNLKQDVHRTSSPLANPFPLPQHAQCFAVINEQLWVRNGRAMLKVMKKRDAKHIFETLSVAPST